jgi:branched-chain amino acid transport system substrate-binding protein
MVKQTILAGALALAASTALAQTALAQEVKIGVALPYTGIGAELAQQVDRGIEQYLKQCQRGAAYKITLVKRLKDGRNQRAPVVRIAHRTTWCARGLVYCNAIAAPRC